MKNENSLISVIVPVYNVEKYLDRCVRSIVNQSYSKLEIILVDDGSPDECPKICDEWKKKDKRIRVIHKINGGLSDARNAGLAVATGEYIAFVDSDDWVDLKLYQTLLDALERTDSDIACCKVAKVWDESYIDNLESTSGELELYDTECALTELIMDQKIQQIVWNKLYKRKLLSEILFAKGKCHEDEFWTYQVFGLANQSVIIDYYGYYYFQRDNSIMGVGYSLKRLDVVEAKVLRQEYLKNHFPRLEIVGRRNLLFTCIYHGQMSLKWLDRAECRKTIRYLKYTFKENMFDRAELKQLVLKDRIWLRLGKQHFAWICKIRKFLGIGF